MLSRLASVMQESQLDAASAILEDPTLAIAFGIDLSPHSRLALAGLLRQQVGTFAETIQRILQRRTFYFVEQVRMALKHAETIDEEHARLLNSLHSKLSAFGMPFEERLKQANKDTGIAGLTETSVDQLLFAALRSWEALPSAPKWLISHAFRYYRASCDITTREWNGNDEGNGWWALRMLLLCDGLNKRQRTFVTEACEVALVHDAATVGSPLETHLRLEVTSEICGEDRTRLFIVLNMIELARRLPHYEYRLCERALAHWRQVRDKDFRHVYLVALRYRVGSVLREYLRGVAASIEEMGLPKNPGGDEQRNEGADDVASQVRVLREEVHRGRAEVKAAIIQARDVVLDRFDKNESTIVWRFVERLEERDAATANQVLENLEVSSLNLQMAEEAWNAVADAVSAMRNALGDIDALSGERKGVAEDIASWQEAIEDAHFKVEHKLRLSIPLIPFILKYQAEMKLTRGANLTRIWERLVRRVRE